VTTPATPVIHRDWQGAERTGPGPATKRQCRAWSAPGRRPGLETRIRRTDSVPPCPAPRKGVFLFIHCGPQAHRSGAGPPGRNRAGRSERAHSGCRTAGPAHPCSSRAGPAGGGKSAGVRARAAGTCSGRTRSWAGRAWTVEARMRVERSTPSTGLMLSCRRRDAGFSGGDAGLV
jgi:hypothetical protein